MDYKTGSRITLDEALERQWIERRQADKLADLRRYARSIVDLRTNLLVSIFSTHSPSKKYIRLTLLAKFS